MSFPVQICQKIESIYKLKAKLDCTRQPHVLLSSLKVFLSLPSISETDLRCYRQHVLGRQQKALLNCHLKKLPSIQMPPVKLKREQCIDATSKTVVRAVKGRCLATGHCAKDIELLLLF